MENIKKYYLIDIKKYEKILNKFNKNNNITIKDINDLIEGEISTKDIIKFTKI